MKQKFMKKLVAWAMAIFVMTPMLAYMQPVLAETIDPWGGQEQAVKDTGLGQKDPREIAGGVIKVALGFLGIIAVVIILLGGFKWMTAMGNEDKASEARKLISAGVIGLVIILAAYGIATFVLSSAMSVTAE
jgi:hypothetical protein